MHIAPMSFEIAPRKLVKTIAYNGSVPGPLLRMKEGQPVTIDVFNDTGDAEIVHWHGLQIPSAVDGAMEEGTPMIPAHALGALYLHAQAQRHALVSHARHGRTESETRHVHRAVRIFYIDPRS
jgi:FtsP/CotA-like multicopper oxidase with cupredoxin domain